MQEVAPGLSRWLEYINKPSNVMTACHAVVQRMLLESLGLVAPTAGTALTLPRLEPPAQLDMALCFADDGFLAGASGEVLRALKHLLAVMPQVGLRFSSLQLVAAAGPHHRVNFDPFLALACTVNAMATLRFSSPPLAQTLSVNPTRRVLSTSSSVCSKPSLLFLTLRLGCIC